MLHQRRPRRTWNNGSTPLNQVEVDVLQKQLLTNAIFFFLRADPATPRTREGALACAALTRTARQQMARELKLVDVLFCMYRAPKDNGITDADLTGRNDTEHKPLQQYLKPVLDIQAMIAKLLTVCFKGLRASEFYIATTKSVLRRPLASSLAAMTD